MAQMVRCKKCGHMVKENAKVCPNCGTKNRLYNIRLAVGVLCLFLGLALLWSAKFGRTQSQDSGNFVTRLNYDLIVTQMNYETVCEMFGMPGTVIEDAPETQENADVLVYEWRTADGNGSCRIVFQNDSVLEKSQENLR